jgi:hypothetical protein
MTTHSLNMFVQVVVFKEVRYLESLLSGMSTSHKSIPHTIRSKAKEAINR